MIYHPGHFVYCGGGGGGLEKMRNEIINVE